jgi:hypothetical protein
MNKLVRLDHLRDPDAPAHVADAFGQPMGAVYLNDLADWAWVVERLDSWLTNSSSATQADYAAFVADRYGPCPGPSLSDLCWMLGAMSWRMRVLVNGVGS